MLDTILIKAITKALNRHYRSQSKPRGEMDIALRGTRMAYNNSYRFGNSLISLPLFAIGIGEFFVFSHVSGRPLPSVLFVVTLWMGIMALACFLPLRAFREFVVVTDDGLIRSNLFGQQTRIEWKDVSSLSFKTDENGITFLTAAGTRLETSLCYNGWADLLEISARHLNAGLQFQLEGAVQNETRKAPRLAKVNS